MTTTNRNESTRKAETKSMILLCHLILLVCLCVGCGSNKTKSNVELKGYFVANYPLKFMTQRLLGSDEEIIYPIPSDIDPAFWKPGESDINQLQACKLIILNGATYSKWRSKVSLRNESIIDTSSGFKDKWIIEQGETHSHGPEGEHSHAETAFTTWLDPELAIAQATAIRDALVKHLPDQSDRIDQQLIELKKDLAALATALDECHSSYKSEPLYASHPVYQYLARRYKWKLESLHWEPERMPDDKQWQEFNALHTQHKGKWMIWEDEPGDAIRKKLEELGIQCVVFSPCGNQPDSGDYLQVMQQNITNLKAALSPAAPSN